MEESKIIIPRYIIELKDGMWLSLDERVNPPGTTIKENARIFNDYGKAKWHLSNILESMEFKDARIIKIQICMFTYMKTVLLSCCVTT